MTSTNDDTTTIERNLVQLLQSEGGTLPLDQLRSKYNSNFTPKLNVNRKLSKWIQSFPSFSLERTEKNAMNIVLNRSIAEIQVVTDNNSTNATNANDKCEPLKSSDVVERQVSELIQAIRGELTLLRESINNDQMAQSFPNLNNILKADSEMTNVLDREEEKDIKDYSTSKALESLEECLGNDMKPIKIYQESKSLLDILPHKWHKILEHFGLDALSEISLDFGRRPHFWHHNKRFFFYESHEEVVQNDDLQFIVGKLGDIGSDNRAGINGQLHRISCIRNNKNIITGLTIRIGRHIEGNSDMIRDLLLRHTGSILFLGEPGTGKTTVVRDVAKILSQNDQNVFIIDTSNEIAGNGDICHPCIGNSRRMMVPSLDAQSSVMIECVQNHTPTVMVIDEIGRRKEVEAAQTSKNRGVRMIASAHGNMRSLIKNKELRGLIGGLESVTLGDAAAKELQKKRGTKDIAKQVTMRAGDPIFDIIIELQRGRLNEWNIILDTAAAVDDILFGKLYRVQKRMRCTNTGRIFIENIQS